MSMRRWYVPDWLSCLFMLIGLAALLLANVSGARYADSTGRDGSLGCGLCIALLASFIGLIVRSFMQETDRTLDVRNNLTAILRVVDTPMVKDRGLLRDLRAIQALERIGTSQARAVLQALASGNPGRQIRKRADAALVRLSNRPEESGGMILGETKH